MNLEYVFSDLMTAISNNPLIFAGFLMLGLLMIGANALYNPKEAKKKKKAKRDAKFEGSLTKQEMLKLHKRQGAYGGAGSYKRPMANKINRKKNPAKEYKRQQKLLRKNKVFGAGRDVGTRKVRPVGGNLQRMIKEEQKIAREKEQARAKAAAKAKAKGKRKKKKKDSTGLGF